MTTQQPRIYTYKVTFVNAPFWYWGVHKEKRYGEVYFGTPVTHKWAWEFYEPEIQILELFPYTDEGWDEACEVEKRLIRPDLNEPYCLNENVGGYFSLEVLRKAHAEKDEDGKSVARKKGAAVTNAKLTKEEKSEICKKGAAAANAEKDVDGKSVNAKKGAAAVHAEKDEDGKSVNAKKGAAAAHAEKDEDGGSFTAKKGGAATKLKTQKKVELTRVLDKATFVFDSKSDACRSLDLDRRHLSNVCLGKRKTHRGYTARYLP